MAMDAEEMANIALRAAERKAKANDYRGAKKFALRAQSTFPSLKKLDGFLAAYGVHLAYESSKLPNGVVDWRAVLLADPAADHDALKKQYKKMCLLTHPDKNSSAAADGAFKLVKEAWSMLSSSTAVRPQAPPPPSETDYFWVPQYSPPPPPPRRGPPRSHVLLAVCPYCQTLNNYVASGNGKYTVGCSRCKRQTTQTVVGIGSEQYPLF